MTHFQATNGQVEPGKPETSTAPLLAVVPQKKWEPLFNWDQLPGSIRGSAVALAGATVPVKKGDGNLHDAYFDFLSLATPSRKEDEMVVKLKKYIPHLKTDTRGNAYVIIGGKTADTMFSCHMDTVHDKVRPLTLHMTVNATNVEKAGFLFATRDSKKDGSVSSVLGADDRTGMYIMTRLIMQKVPGLYVFHVEEESGGGGSTFFASQNAKGSLATIKRCIAFDRKGYTDVITHQRGGQRFASDDFGLAIAKQLNLNLPPKTQYSLSRNGSFTDSANYGKIVPECINLSVGYFDQHTFTEHQDSVWLEHILLPSVLKVDFEALPAVRDPAAVERHTYSYGGHAGYYDFGGRNNNYYDRWRQTTKLRPGDQYWDNDAQDWLTVPEPTGDAAKTSGLVIELNGQKNKEVGTFDGVVHANANTSWAELPKFSKADKFSSTTPYAKRVDIVIKSHMNNGITTRGLAEAFVDALVDLEKSDKDIAARITANAINEAKIVALEADIQRYKTTIQRIYAELTDEQCVKLFGKPKAQTTTDTATPFSPVTDIGGLNERTSKLSNVAMAFHNKYQRHQVARSALPEQFSRVTKLMDNVEKLDGIIVDMARAKVESKPEAIKRCIAEANVILRVTEPIALAVVNDTTELDKYPVIGAKPNGANDNA